MSNFERKNSCWTYKNNTRFDISRREFILKGLGSLIALHPAVSTLSHLYEWDGFLDSENRFQEYGLPLGTLTPEELERDYKTKIHNLSQTEFPYDYVELYLRWAVAFEPLFQKLAHFDQTLDIVLVDSYTVDPGALTREQYMYIYNRTPEVLTVLTDYFLQNREANRREIEDNRYTMQLEYYSRLQELDSRRTTMSADQYSVESSALIYLYSRYFRLEPTEEDLRHPHAIHGLFFPKQITTQSQHNNYIFLAVRDLADGLTITEGDVSLTVKREHLNAPRPSQSYPTIEDFSLLATTMNDESYVVQPNGPGQTLRHEFVHENRLFTEPQADLLAVQQMAAAGEYMRQTGSDEYYWAVFRTPEGLTIT